MRASYSGSETVAALPSASGDPSSDEPPPARLAELADHPSRAAHDAPAPGAAGPLQVVRLRRAVVVHAAAPDDALLLARVQRAAARHERAPRLPAVHPHGPRDVDVLPGRR